MKQRLIKLLIFILLPLLAVSGCDLLDGERGPEEGFEAVHTSLAQTQDAQHIIETIVAETLAALPPSEETQIPSEIPPILAPTATVTATTLPTDMPTAAPTLTATPSVPMAEVSVPTNCRTGPGKIYDQVSVLDVGKRVEVVARNASGTYWVVQNPGGSGVCWLWGNYAAVTGPTANLPVWDAPPTPTPIPGLTATPTLPDVTLQVSIPTNCRIGPGKAYEILSVLRPGKAARVLARHGTADFWVIENPEGSGYCWVWGEYAVISGSTVDLPIWAAPPTPTLPSGVTPTTTGVALQVSVDTNCRTGPGHPYDIVTIFRIGKTAEVIGRNAASTYWVINNPTGSGHCWVWGKYANLTGPASDLPVWDIPPTPTP